jgi:hypothetical protein
LLSVSNQAIIVARPLCARIGINPERVENLTESSHGIRKGCRITSRRGKWELDVTLGLETEAVDTELGRGIEVAAVHARATTGCTLGLIDLSLKSFPGRLLSRIQSKATG